MSRRHHRHGQPRESVRPGRRPLRQFLRRGCVPLLAAMVLGSCDDPTSLPTAPDEELQTEEQSQPDAPPSSATSIFSDRAHPLSGEEYQVVSNEEEMSAGL